MKNKKGVELSVNTVIIIVIALLVLVVIAYILIKSVGNQGDQTSCQRRGGECYPKNDKCSTHDRIDAPWGCPKEGGSEKRCCIPTPGS